MDWSCLARTLFANADIPLLGTSAWLVVGISAIAGLVEAALLHRWYDVRPVVVKWTGAGTAEAIGMADEPEEWSLRSTLFVVAANVISAVLGLLLLAHNDSFRHWILGSRPLERIGLYFITLWLLTFLVSAAIEWPFFSTAIKDRPLSREGLAVCLGCNIISSAGILIGMSMIGMTPSGTTTVDSFSLAKSPYAHVYFVDPATNHVMGMDSSGLNLHDTSFVVPDGQELSAEQVGNDTKLVRLGSSGKAASIYDFGQRCKAANVDVNDRDGWTRDARYFSADDKRMYDVHYGPFASDGLSVVKSNDIYKIAVDSSLVSWHWSHVTVLPNGQAIGQLGPQIVLVDLESGATAVLAKGECPTVVVDK